MIEAVDPRLLTVQDDVREHFAWSYEEDANSAMAMHSALSGPNPFNVEHWSPNARLTTLASLMVILNEASGVVVVGAAAEPNAVKAALKEGCVVVAADGAVGACHNVVNVECVVTDLDGGEHLQQAATGGVPLILHAHGDNLDAWQTYLKAWSSQPSPPPLVLTHQTNEPLDGMHNPGGFTDGDRAVCFVLAAGVTADRIHCVGFSSASVGRWSGKTEPVRKLEKLRWMERIIAWVLPQPWA